MADHLSDEEQLEALKRWWQQNGVQLLLVIALTAAGWFGWHWWQDRQAAIAADSAVVYNAMLDRLGEWQREPTDEGRQSIVSYARTLKDTHPNSQYARYASLVLARIALAEGDAAGAATELQWVVDQADDALKDIARYRLARLEFANGDGDRALGLLSQNTSPELAALVAELKGDIHASQGDNAAARASYQSALEQLVTGAGQSARPMIELKLNQVMPAEDSTQDADEEGA
ncbi:MAG: hypothetical protein CMK32_04760 [Porticoccaceae bacterium]|nr:hypothetical protein [Porticoccaceae bacterium]